MYTVNIYYCYYVLHSASFLSFLTHFSQFLPPFFDPSLFPFSLFLLYFSQFLLCFSHFLDHSFSFFLFLPVLAPFPFIQFLPLFSEFALLPFYLFLPQSLSCLSFFPSSYFPFSSSFHFPLLSVPSVPLLFIFQFVLLFVQLMSFLLCRSCLLFSPFFYADHASFSLFLFPLPTFHSHYSIFSVLTIHLFFPIPLPFLPVPVGVLLVLSLYLM